MTWSHTWKDILNGGHSRWKVTDIAAKKAALEHIGKYTSSTEKLSIFCPLAGDDSFVHYAWTCGHSVTSIDLVPEAVAALRQQWEGTWTSHQSNHHRIWSHESGRATMYEGDALAPLLASNTFDAVYDKDAMGALDLSLRKTYGQRLQEYLKQGGIVYTEVKNTGNEGGPPFHMEQKDVQEILTDCDYVEYLGQVYELEGAGMTQHGHILRKR